MKRFLSASLVLAILVLGLLPTAPPVLAHAITVDGDASDWTMAAPTNANTGHIGRDSSSRGEYVWNDWTGDVRTDGTDPDSNYDLTGFRVTGDANNLYFLATFDDITASNLPYISIAVDTDRTNGSGESWFGDYADTQTSADAEWERLIVVNLNKTGYYDTGWTWTSAGSSYIDTTNDVIEIGMPLTDLGLTWPATVRFTVIVCQHNGSGGVQDISGVSDALDVVTNYGDPGLTGGTWDEVSDGVVDYYFDVYFGTNGEPFPPLLVSEVFYDAPGSEPAEEWIQIYNATNSSMSLDGWKIGDEETVDGGEGMYQFPAGFSVASHDSVIVANQATAFSGLGYGCSPDFEVSDTDATPDMSKYTNWATGSWALGNSSDEILLLDPQDTVVDVMTYGSGSYPGVTAHADVPAGNSVERDPPGSDTNDCSNDFTSVGSNGTPCDVPTAVTLASFTAEGNGRSVLLRWETASELNNLGFNLYRAAETKGVGAERVRLNDALIQAVHPGSPFGASYEFNDETAMPGVTYLYWLEDVDIYGVATLHGPVSVRLKPLHRLLPVRPRLAPASAQAHR